jgi:hypothetical protein
LHFTVKAIWPFNRYTTTSLSAVTIAMRSCGEQRTLRSGWIGADETLEVKSGSCGGRESEESSILV